MKHADVVIIGSGFAGASTAFHLARQGVRDIVILEREPVPGFHASGRNAALAFTVLEDPTEARLAVEGAAFLANPPEGFTEEPLVRWTGSLLVASGEEGMASVGSSARLAASLGLQGEVVSAADAEARVPVVAEAGLHGAFWNPHDGVVDIHALLQGYLGEARRRGVQVKYESPVLAVKTSRGQVEAVVTPQETWTTRCVVNAGGGWAGEVGILAGVGRRSLAPRRRHLFQTRIESVIDPDWPFVWHTDIDTYFRPEGEGLLMSPCDATPHPARDPQIDGAATLLLAEKLAVAFPRLANARVASGWACLRTFASDERFVIGRDPELEGFVWVAGLGGHGMTTSPAVGRLGSEAVLGVPSDALAWFSPDRLVDAPATQAAVG